jgi:hypothetical protein
MRNFQKCSKSNEKLPNINKIPRRSSENAQNPMLEVLCGILCIFGSSLWDFVPVWKFLMGFCAFSEDPGGILCIFGSSSWDFVQFWKFLVGFCAFLEVPHVILCSFGSSSLDFVHFWKFLVGLRNFQKCSKSNEKLPNINKIPRGSSENAQNPMIDFE